MSEPTLEVIKIMKQHGVARWKAELWRNKKGPGPRPKGYRIKNDPEMLKENRETVDRFLRTFKERVQQTLEQRWRNR